MSRCVCCGLTTQAGVRVDSGPIHFDCWDEHHSDPTGAWPASHICDVEADR